MKNLFLASVLLLPSVFLGQENPRGGRAVTVVCQSRGAGPASPITIAFSAGAKFGTEIYNGVISSIGVQTHIFPISLEGEQKSEAQFSVNFENEIGAAPEQTIKGTLTLDIKELTVDGEVIAVPTGTGLVELSVKPVIGNSVHTKYLLNDCAGMLK